MKKIVMLSVPPASGVDVIGPLEAFGIASRMVQESSGRRGYESELVTNSADLALTTSSGVKILAHKHYSELRGKIDTLLIAGGAGTRGPRDPALLAWLRKMAKQARRICSICTGAYLLADAGLLEGKRATTHWKLCREFRAPAPRSVVGPESYLREGWQRLYLRRDLRGHGSRTGAHRGGLR